MPRPLNQSWSLRLRIVLHLHDNHGDVMPSISTLLDIGASRNLQLGPNRVHLSCHIRHIRFSVLRLDCQCVEVHFELALCGFEHSRPLSFLLTTFGSYRQLVALVPVCFAVSCRPFALAFAEARLQTLLLIRTS